MVPQEKVRSSSRRHEIVDEEDDSSSSSSSSCSSVQSTRRTAPRSKVGAQPPLDSVTQEEVEEEEEPALSAVLQAVKVTTTTREEEATSSLSPSPPVEHVVLDASASSSLRTASRTSSNMCFSPNAAIAVAVADDASVSDISTGSCCAQSSPRSIFKMYWEKSGELHAPSLIRASSTSTTASSSSMASAMSSVPLHSGSIRGGSSAPASPRSCQDPSKLEYEDSFLMLAKEEEAPSSHAKAGHQEEELEDLGCVRRRSIIGQHGYRSHSEPSLCLHAMAFSSRSATTPPGAVASSITSLACFFAPFRKTRSASTLHDHPKASSSLSGTPATAKSCLRRGRFSSSSFSDMTTSSTTTTTSTSSKSSRSEELPPLSPVLSDAGSVTFNEDDNRVVVFDAPRELWSQRGWSDYFAC
jgi:hypothetical protein